MHIFFSKIHKQLCYSLWNFGIAMTFPYLTLQARNLGLTYEDISYVYGIIPVFTFFSSPFAGFLVINTLA